MMNFIYWLLLCDTAIPSGNRPLWILQVFLFQKAAVYKCNMAGKPAVITRVVDSMTDNLRPTRAEATDVANAVLDGMSLICKLLVGILLISLVPLSSFLIVENILLLIMGFSWLDCREYMLFFKSPFLCFDFNTSLIWKLPDLSSLIMKWVQEVMPFFLGLRLCEDCILLRLFPSLVKYVPRYVFSLLSYGWAFFTKQLCFQL